jgi:hypothetical protein
MCEGNCEGKCSKEVKLGVYKKLLEFQKLVKPIKKDSTNPHFRNKYFDINGLLEEVKPKLNQCGLIVTQLVHELTLTSQVIDVEDGSSIESKCLLPNIVSDPQKMGSAITYMRRYTLQALLGLEGEDEDAEGFYDRKPTNSTKPATTGTKTWTKPAPKTEG